MAVANPSRDDEILTEALAIAIVALDQLSPRERPKAYMDSLRGLLGGRSGKKDVSLYLARATCRLFPGVDPSAVYREYGLSAPAKRGSAR